MGPIANRMAVELLIKIKKRIEERRERTSSPESVRRSSENPEKGSGAGKSARSSAKLKRGIWWPATGRRK